MPVTTGIARQRREDEYTPGTANFYNHQYQMTGAPPPAGFEIGKSGTVSTQDSGFQRLIDSPWFPALMAGGFGGGGLLASGLSGTGILGGGLAAGPGVTTGLPAGFGSAATSGGIASGPAAVAGLPAATSGSGGIVGALDSLKKWLPLIGAGTSLGSGIFAGRQAERDRQAATGGMDFAALAPLMMLLLQQQMQQSNENYTAQKAKAAQSAPLQQAVTHMATSLLPNMYRP